MCTNNVPGSDGRHPFMCEAIWFDKPRYDEAERLYYEMKAKDTKSQILPLGNTAKDVSPAKVIHKEPSTPKVSNEVTIKKASDELLGGNSNELQNEEDTLPPRINSVCDKIDEVRHRIKTYMDELESRRSQKTSVSESGEKLTLDEALQQSVVRQVKWIAEENEKLKENVSHLQERVEHLETIIKGFTNIKSEFNAQIENFGNLPSQGIAPSWNGNCQ